jgi:hypothetical protein
MDHANSLSPRMLPSTLTTSLVAAAFVMCKWQRAPHVACATRATNALAHHLIMALQHLSRCLSAFKRLLPSDAVPFPPLTNHNLPARTGAPSPRPAACDFTSAWHPLLVTSCYHIFRFTEVALFHRYSSAHHQHPTPCSRHGIHSARVEAGARCVRRTARDGMAA